jgi:hypothetical protein
MMRKRLVAAAAAASLVTVGFLASAAPASAWTKRDCEITWKLGKDHPDCAKYKTTTTEKKTTTTEAKKSTTTTTVMVKPEVIKPPAAVKVTPKFTG